MKKIFFSSIIITCVLRAQALAFSVAGAVEKGNRLYGDKKYQDALKHYDQALAKQPDSAIINFDSGAAQYKTKEYQKANSLFERSLITEDKGLEAKANYNLGNSKYMLGSSKENTDLSAAVQLLEGALNNYKRTQELTPKDEDVKVNYKIVAEKLKELKEKLKQQPQENKNNQKQDQQNQEQPQKQQGDSQQKEEDQSSQQQSASAPKEQEKSGDKQGQDQQAQEPKQEGQDKQGQSTTTQPPTKSEESKGAFAQPQ
ncbi:MAG: tetratricopeptide repeat protein [Candidatus Omnitrophica bacterium]|nr:tetratricopeptide repeat protein [Candidatus Omnitrophota bacterium]